VGPRPTSGPGARPKTGARPHWGRATVAPSPGGLGHSPNRTPTGQLPDGHRPDSGRLLTGKKCRPGQSTSNFCQKCAHKQGTLKKSLIYGGRKKLRPRISGLNSKLR